MRAIGSKEGEYMKRKKTNPHKRVMTKADLDKAKKDAIRTINILAITAAAMSAHDVFDFGPKRIERLVIDMLHKYNDFDAGFYTIDDALEWVEDYAGLRIEEVVDDTEARANE